MDDTPFGDGLAARYFWSRHADPWSVWAMVVAFPTFVLAIYRRDRRLFAGTLLAVALNPLLASPPDDDDAWATKVVLGERVWLDGGRLLSRETAFVACCAPVYLYTLRAAVERRPVGTACGTVVSMVLMLAFFRRMARLYEERADGRRSGERSS
ncbi:MULTISPECIES: DUF6653 family protein [Halorussus]|uniref:DUF6653 family protein n=1 Tax=Halorussus TaxID=1070314 RepID=UPI0020A23225|nr:DUF6653 family protein [Halorussus vallis]USZ74227.1 hypothetical protein NGM07_12310 [Halorussus vallis]